MSKTFKKPPRPAPSEDAIAAFEAGGAGHDTVGTTHIPTNVGKKRNGNDEAEQGEPTKRLSIDMPRSMHLRFKTACSAVDTKMAREILDFIERRTAELEVESGRA